MSANDIQNILARDGYQTDQVERLLNNNKSRLSATIKTTFSDIKKRGAFVTLLEPYLNCSHCTDSHPYDTYNQKEKKTQ